MPGHHEHDHRDGRPRMSDRPETAPENPNGFVGKCDVPTGPVPTDSDRAKVKKALGELGEVTTAVEAMARLLAEERERHAVALEDAAIHMLTVGPMFGQMRDERAILLASAIAALGDE